MLNAGDSPAHPQLWRSRWSELFDDGLRRDADVGWLVGEQGFVLVCRDLPFSELEMLAADPGLAALLDELDDRLVAFPGPMPSDRARALLEVALSADASEVSLPARIALAPAGADPHDDGVRAQVDGILTDLRLWFGAGSRAEGRRHQEVPIVVSHHVRGDVVLLSTRDHPVPGMAPDLVRAPFQRIDASFALAMERAMTAVGTRGGVRYLVRSRRTGAPLDAIGGRSAGLGAAMALRRLADPAAAPLDPDWCFTGAVDGDGAVTTLCGPEGRSEYGAKLSSLDRGALVYPAVDRTEVERLGDARAPGTRLEPVATVADAERRVARHIEGRRAYERAIESRQQVSRLAVVAIAALAALLLWLWIDHFRHEAGAARARRLEAAGDVVSVPWRDPDNGARSILIDRAQVTNRQYRTCAEADECRWPDPDREQAPIDDDANAPQPVTGISVADAAAFCEWVHGDRWSVPVADDGSRSAGAAGDGSTPPDLVPVDLPAASSGITGLDLPDVGFRCASSI
ncbi:MAG: SUMF1/EgtB/PvdO family nonheme iron enzyme [Acidimicrobiales bacterium]